MADLRLDLRQKAKNALQFKVFRRRHTTNDIGSQSLDQRKPSTAPADPPRHISAESTRLSKRPSIGSIASNFSRRSRRAATSSKAESKRNSRAGTGSNGNVVVGKERASVAVVDQAAVDVVVAGRESVAPVLHLPAIFNSTSTAATSAVSRPQSAAELLELGDVPITPTTSRSTSSKAAAQETDQVEAAVTGGAEYIGAGSSGSCQCSDNIRATADGQSATSQTIISKSDRSWLLVAPRGGPSSPNNNLRAVDGAKQEEYHKYSQAAEQPSKQTVNHRDVDRDEDRDDYYEEDDDDDEDGLVHPEGQTKLLLLPQVLDTTTTTTTTTAAITSGSASFSRQQPSQQQHQQQQQQPQQPQVQPQQQQQQQQQKQHRPSNPSSDHAASPASPISPTTPSATATFESQPGEEIPSSTASPSGISEAATPSPSRPIVEATTTPCGPEPSQPSAALPQNRNCTSPITPSLSTSGTRTTTAAASAGTGPQLELTSSTNDDSGSTSPQSTGPPPRPPLLPRRQSIFPETRFTDTLRRTSTTQPGAGIEEEHLLQREHADRLRNLSVDSQLTQLTAITQATAMAHRKIWVKRAGSSPTAVTVNDDDMVDDVRDVILRKYGNSLGRSFDSPDLILRIYPRSNRNRSVEMRGHGQERMLSPDELIGRIIDDYFPGGQSADEALVIEVPTRRTPRPSPQPVHYTYESNALMADGVQDYFSVPLASSAHSQGTPAGSVQAAVNQPSISVLGAGQVPIIPGSPGRHPQQAPPPQSQPSHQRPGMGRRMNTSSPTIHSTASSSRGKGGEPNGPIILRPRKPRSRGSSDAQPPVETTQVNTPGPVAETDEAGDSPVPARVASPQPAKSSFKKPDKPDLGAPPPGHAVPPIKVLIVEDNTINLRLLEAFMKRLKVRWETAVNGKIAVEKWRAGGFHLVLMDIQLPVMSGLEATKEIRRLERVNKIGSKHLNPSLQTSQLQGGAAHDEDPGPVSEEDKLPDSILFRSPVIIVALTASSLQSDRHEAYAAGCNDFLTKPVNFIWLEKKVTEWGCMQALIDWHGWRKWKEDPENLRLRDLENKKSSPKNKRGQLNLPKQPAPKKDKPASDLIGPRKSPSQPTSPNPSAAN